MRDPATMNRHELHREIFELRERVAVLEQQLRAAQDEVTRLEQYRLHE